MRRVRYQVACSLDGYIAGPNGEIDWITGAEDVDFGGLFAQFDTLLMGRRTYEQVAGGTGGFGKMRIVVVSRTLRAEDHRGVEVVSRDVAARVAELKEGEGRDIWLFGGGGLFRTLLAAGQVDTIEPAIVPVVLGGGVPMYPSPFARARLRLTGHRVSEKGGLVLLEYTVL
ncbi:MAG TPA: dihydrofolate reductase family protein [Longimicrobiales bacterium]